MAEETKQEVVAVNGNQPAPVQADVTTITSQVDADELLYMAEQADKRVKALDKIIKACFKITNANDWVNIGGTLYLTESGTMKVASLIGISFEIVPGFPLCEIDSQGYKTYTYRVRAFGKSSHVEGEGSRSMKEDFFRKTKDGFKQPEEIKDRDVKIAALTNAKNNAIKSIIPGLKNVTEETLRDAGIDLKDIKGYTFKEGSHGGKDKDDAKSSGLFCKHCGQPVTQKVASYSQTVYKCILCVDCQNKVKDGSLKLSYKPKETPKEIPESDVTDAPVNDINDDDRPF